MQRILIILSITFSLVFISANKLDDNKKSRVLYIGFAGYGEDQALIYGKIRYFNGKDTIPLDSAKLIILNQKSKKDTALYTDSSGQWGFYSWAGHFNLLIQKKEFQSLNLYKYNSVPDRETKINILLEKGTGTQSYTISENIYKYY
ncbi:MAG TPA: hypothetical protein VK809_08055, partial [Bacteroidia bacterium]|nr:hypothetical protein [Bacteroidia bacterium]